MFSLVACVFDVCTSQECDRSYLSSEIKFLQLFKEWMFSLVACVFDVCTSQECDRSYLSSEIKLDNFSRNGGFRL